MPSPTTTTLYGVWGSSATNIFAVGGNPGNTAGNPGVILHWDGVAWSLTPSLINLLAVGGVDFGLGYVFAVGEYGQEGSLTRSENGPWSERTVLAAGSLRGVSVHGVSAPQVYVVGDRGQILHSPFNGERFIARSSGTTTTLRAVWASRESNDVYAVGDRDPTLAVILHSTDGGVNWSRATAATGVSNLYGIWGSSADDVYVAGGFEDTGIVLHSTNRGASWSAVTLSGAWGLYAVGGTSASDIYVAGELGHVFHSTGNEQWTQEATPAPQALYGVWGASSGEVYAVGSGGVILRKLR